MSQPSDNTIRYYDDHTDEYVTSTFKMDMESLYQPFLELIPACGRILDAGCGSGRDTKAFLERGYDVTAIDASSKMVESAAQLTGVTVEQVCFQELEYEAEFHGVWACASLLHVPQSELDDVLERIQLALRPGGVCCMSFKLGEEERLHGDRRWIRGLDFRFLKHFLRVCRHCLGNVGYQPMVAFPFPAGPSRAGFPAYRPCSGV